MTLASTVLDAMRDVLDERLGDAAKEVRVHEGDIGTDPKNNIRGKDPLVLVTCLGADLQPDGYGVAEGVFAVFVICLQGARGDSGAISKSIAAANIAFLVASIVENETWNGTTVRTPEKVRVANEVTEKTNYQAGWAVWSVAWRQPFEIKQADATEYGRLGSIHYTLEQTDAASPDAQATVEFPLETSP